MHSPLVAPAPILPCPRCGAAHVVRNGRTQSGSPNLLCRGCGRCFVPEPKKSAVSEERKALVRWLLLERLSLRGVARAAGVSRSWLQRFVNAIYREETAWDPGPLEKSRAG